MEVPSLTPFPQEARRGRESGLCPPLSFHLTILLRTSSCYSPAWPFGQLCLASEQPLPPAPLAWSGNLAACFPAAGLL